MGERVIFVFVNVFYKVNLLVIGEGGYRIYRKLIFFWQLGIICQFFLKRGFVFIVEGSWKRKSMIDKS